MQLKCSLNIIHTNTESDLPVQCEVEKLPQKPDPLNFLKWSYSSGHLNSFQAMQHAYESNTRIFSGFATVFDLKYFIYARCYCLIYTYI
jgi:hypothetical protein